MMLTLVGLGEYLHEIHEDLTVEEHINHLILWYKVHAQRNFNAKFRGNPPFGNLNRLWNAETHEEYLQEIDTFCLSHPQCKSWLKGKKKAWIAGGFNQHLSRVPSSAWEAARKHTNMSKSSNFEHNNFVGRKMTLLGGVLGYV
jgi:hypothetical protein